MAYWAIMVKMPYIKNAAAIITVDLQGFRRQ